LYGVTDLSCDCRGLVTAINTIVITYECSVGLTAATNTLEFTYTIQCIRRRVLTYAVLRRWPLLTRVWNMSLSVAFP